MPSSLLSAVCALLRVEVIGLRDVELRADTPLLSAGLLDSFAIVTLVAELERSLSIELDVEQIEVSQFETPASIAALCEATAKKRAAARPA